MTDPIASRARPAAPAPSTRPEARPTEPVGAQPAQAPRPDAFDGAASPRSPAPGAVVQTASAAPVPTRDLFDSTPTTDPLTRQRWYTRLVADPAAYGELPAELRGDAAFAAAVVSAQPALYPLLPESLRGIRELAFGYLAQATRRPDGSYDPAPLRHVPASILADRTLQGGLFTTFDTLDWVPASLRTPELLGRAIDARRSLIRQLDPAEAAALLAQPEHGTLPEKLYDGARQILEHPERIAELSRGAPDALVLAFRAAPELGGRVPLAIWRDPAFVQTFSLANADDTLTAVRNEALAQLPESVRLALIEQYPSAVLLGDGVGWLPSKFQVPDALAYVVQQRPRLISTVPPPLGTSPDFIARVTNDATLRSMTDAQLAVAPDGPTVRLERLVRDPSKLTSADVELARQVAERSPESTRRFPEPLRDAAAIMRSAVLATKGRALEWAGPRLKDDPGLVADAVAEDPLAFSFASDRLRADPVFVRQLLPLAAEHPLSSALRFAAPELRASKAFAETIVDQYGALFGELDESLRRDPGLVERALLSSRDAISALVEPIDDKALLLRLVRQDGSYLIKASPRLKADAEVVEAAVRTAPLQGPLPTMPEPDRTRLELLAIARWPLRIKFCKAEDPRTPALLEAAAEKDARVLGLRARAEVPEEIRQALDALAAKRPDLLRQADALSDRFRAQGITRPERLGFPDTALELLAARETNAPDERPLAIAVYSPEDWNAALSQGHFEPLRQGYRVLYFEATRDEGLVEALKAGTATQKASLVLLAGHGARDSMALGAADPQRGEPVAPEKLYLDTTDEAELQAAKLDERLEPGARVVLVSCSTGRGAPGDNVAGMLSRALPSAEIIAPMVSTNEAIRVDAAGRFADPGYDVGPGFTLTIPPRR